MKKEEVFIKHVVGEMHDLIQRCVICGEEVCNYQNAMTTTPGICPSWPVGDLYISQKGNPTIFLTSEPVGDTIINCKAK